MKPCLTRGHLLGACVMAGRPMPGREMHMHRTTINGKRCMDFRWTALASGGGTTSRQASVCPLATTLKKRFRDAFVLQFSKSAKGWGSWKNGQNQTLETYDFPNVLVLSQKQNRGKQKTDKTRFRKKNILVFLCLFARC